MTLWQLLRSQDCSAENAEPLRSFGDLIRQGIAGVCARALPTSLQQRKAAEDDPTMMKTTLSK